MLVAIAAVMWPARRAPAGRAGVGIGEAEARRRIALSRASIALRLGVALVVEALRVQRAVHQQVRVVRLAAAMPCSPRLALDHRRAQHEVGDDHRRALVVEGQHVGGVVLAAELAVQRAALVGADDRAP